MPQKTKAYLALLFVCIAWGTTYLAIKVGVTHYPSFLFAGIRQVAAGVIIMGIAFLFNRQVQLTSSNIKHNMLVGFLMITVGNGLVSWAEQYVPSGVAALICAMMPLFAVMINLMGSDRERINPLIVIGMILGFGGVAINFKDNISDLGKTSYIGGIIALLCATSCWALGSIVNKRRTQQVNPSFNAGMQLFFGGAFLLCISPFVDNYNKANFGNMDAFWALMYLIVVGSVIAYTVYMFALKELPVGLVMIYAYVNPLVAVVLGYWWLKEPITLYTALSFISILLGVYLVNRGYKREHLKALLAQKESVQ